MKNEPERLIYSLPIQQKIDKLNRMILANASLEKKIDILMKEVQELYSLHADPPINGECLFNKLTMDNVSSWIHEKEESGYSIWKYPVSDLIDNSANVLLFNRIACEYKGIASSLISTFDKVLKYDGSTYEDITTIVTNDDDNSVKVLEDTDSYLYLGLNSTFSGADFEIKIAGVKYDIYVEYYNGTDWIEVSNLKDTTYQFTGNGVICFDLPADMQQTEVNGITLYWIRIGTKDVYSAVEISYTSPYNSVYSLLRLSFKELNQEKYKFVYYNGYVYVTIPNTGSSQSEGDFYIRQSSSADKKEEFFKINNKYVLYYAIRETVN